MGQKRGILSTEFGHIQSSMPEASSGMCDAG